MQEKLCEKRETRTMHQWQLAMTVVHQKTLFFLNSLRPKRTHFASFKFTNLGKIRKVRVPYSFRDNTIIQTALGNFNNCRTQWTIGLFHKYRFGSLFAR